MSDKHVEPDQTAQLSDLVVHCLHRSIFTKSEYFRLTLKRQENLHQKKSSVYVVCWIFLQTFQTYFAYRKTVWTQVRLLLEKQSDLGPHCLQKLL